MFPTSLLNSVGGVGGVGQTLTWGAWGAWVHKFLAWVRKNYVGGMGRDFDAGGVGL